MQSLLASLQIKGLKPPINIPSSFQASPETLRQIKKLLEISAPELSNWQSWSNNVDENWTNEVQGFTYVRTHPTENHHIYYFSNQNQLFKVQWDKVQGPFGPIHSLKILKNLHFNDLGFSSSEYHHFGDIDYHPLDSSHGLLLAPLESYDPQKNALLLLFSDDLEFMGWAELIGKNDSTNNGWCAVDPWKKNVVYVSDDNATFFYIYDVQTLYQLESHPSIWPKKVSITLKQNRFNLKQQDGSPDKLSGSLQGVVFSDSGRVYVSQAIPEEGMIYTSWDNYLACYDALTGLRLDYQKTEHPDTTTVGAELQGITINKNTGELELIYLDNDCDWSRCIPPLSWDCFDCRSVDEIDILHYFHPDRRPL